MEDETEYKHVKYTDWMCSDDEPEQISQGQGGQTDDQAFEATRFEGLEGHMRLQLEKTFGGDDRFKLTEDFNVSFKDANRKNAHVSDVMLGALSKREQQDFFHDNKMTKSDRIKDTGGYESLEEGNVEWKHGIDMEREKANALNLLSRIVPANEVFLTSSKADNKKTTDQDAQGSEQINKLVGLGDQSGTKKRAMHIKRFDPTNKNSHALIVPKEEKKESIDEKTGLKTGKKTKGPTDQRQRLMEQGRLQIMNKKQKFSDAEALQERQTQLARDFQNKMIE